jgi:hypothetical protein
LKTNVVEGINLNHYTVFHASIASESSAFADSQITPWATQGPERHAAVLYDKCDAIATLQNWIIRTDSKRKSCLESLVNG